MERHAISILPVNFLARSFGNRIMPFKGLVRFIYFIFYLPFFILIPRFAQAQTAPAIEWQLDFGGPDPDEGFSVIQTPDGGYTVGGYTNSGPDNYIPNFHGYEDAWVIRLNSIGRMQWNECYGGSLDEEINSMVQTSDGGYCCAIRTESDDGEVLNSNNAPSDAWIVKLSATGSIEWQDDLGGSNFNDPFSIIQTTDGGYVFAGFTLSDDGDVTGHHGTLQNADAWVVKLDSGGKMLWGKCLGGSERDRAQAIVQTPDGGYCFAGYTNSLDGDVTGFHGGLADFWVVKLDTVGNIKWQKCLGGDSDDYAFAITMAPDGGFVVAGVTYSGDGDISGYHGNGDIWVVKIDSIGNIEWQKCLGGSGYEIAYSVARTAGGGYVVAGESGSDDGDVSGNHGGFSDAWIVKLDESGNIQWQKCLGGSGTDKASNIIQTKDGQYIFAGSTNSRDGDINYYYGGTDLWVVKLNVTAAVNDAASQSSQNGLLLTAQLFSNSAMLEFEVPAAPADIKIDVTNILGMRIEELDAKAHQIGHQNFPLDLTHFISGTYFITVSACGLTQTIPLSVVK